LVQVGKAGPDHDDVPHPARPAFCRERPEAITMKLTLRIWRQKGPEDEGRMVEYQLDDVSPDMSFLEMLDVLNEKLILKGEDPIAVDHDCREGICGMCSLVIDGTPHGPEKATTTCQLYMRKFKDGDV